jgi:uncharacterized membrane protein YGL010W
VATKKTADQWFNEYGESHQNPINEIVHWICVPSIVLSLIALLWAIPVPQPVREISPYINLGTIMIVLSLLFYLRLSIPLAVGMLLFSALTIAVILAYNQAGLAPLWVAAVTVFVVAWIGQFIGHKIEGKKPSFFKDIQFLLIGPIWLLHFVYRKLGIPY